MAAVVTPRFGRFRPLLTAFVLLLSASLLTLWAPNGIAFRFAVVANLTVMFFALPVLLGYAAALDRGGRASGIVMGTFVVACSVAPFMGGAISDAFGLDSLAYLSVSSFLLSVALLIASNRVIKIPFVSSTARVSMT